VVNGRTAAAATERALRFWLLRSGLRPGDRVPPDRELAKILAVPRTTLAEALRRLDRNGELVRRHGSGTFVRRHGPSTVLLDRLDRLELYSTIARRDGIRLGVRDVEVSSEGADAEVAYLFDVPPATRITRVSRIVTADGRPAAHMTDLVHPDVPLPDAAGLRRAFMAGAMLADVLLDCGVEISFITTRITAKLVRAGDPLVDVVGAHNDTAVLKREETMHLASGHVVQQSRDVLSDTPTGFEVVRRLSARRPQLDLRGGVMSPRLAP
jgi:DNA-binding GntR family transcriptional regulator